MGGKWPKNRKYGPKTLFFGHLSHVLAISTVGRKSIIRPLCLMEIVWPLPGSPWAVSSREGLPRVTCVRHSQESSRSSPLEPHLVPESPKQDMWVSCKSLGLCAEFRVAPVRFGYGRGVERFERFRFSVLAVPGEGRFPSFSAV